MGEKRSPQFRYMNWSLIAISFSVVFRSTFCWLPLEVFILIFRITQGIGEQFDKKRIVKALKKQFACNGTVIEHPEYGEVIQLQGDQRNNVSQFLGDNGLAAKESLKIHGF